MERLSALDAEFLHLEDGIAHMHIAGACVFADPPPDDSRLAALMESKLHLIPRYRQRVRSVPFELGRPVWVDDPHFDLSYHLRRSALPGTGGDREFDALMGRLMSQPLDRERPLWETWLVEGLEGDRWALIFKVHHCLVDGVGGVGLLAALLDVDPDAALPEPVPWEPAPEPAGLTKVLGAWEGLINDTVDTLRALPNAVQRPVETAHRAAELASGFAHYVTGFRGAEPGSLGGTIGPHRVWAHAEVSLAAIKDVRRAFGGTVNDVVLAAISGGYRELLLDRGEDPDHAVINTMVPVSTRPAGEAGSAANRVSMLMVEMPVHLSDPVERLAEVSRRMSELKASHMAEAGDVITRLGELVPPMVIGTFSRTVIRALRRVPQEAITTLTTNVPGPQFPLYCLGHEMLGYRPFVPIHHGVRVATAILSYNGEVSFGFTGDAESSPDVDVLAASVADAVDDLVERAAGA